MGTIKREAEFSHFNDCKQSGCPKHKMNLTIQTTADVLSVYIDGVPWFNADPHEWKALKSMLHDMYYDYFDLKYKI